MDSIVSIWCYRFNTLQSDSMELSGQVLGPYNYNHKYFAMCNTSN